MIIILPYPIIWKWWLLFLSSPRPPSHRHLMAFTWLAMVAGNAVEITRFTSDAAVGLRPFYSALLFTERVRATQIRGHPFMGFMFMALPFRFLSSKTNIDIRMMVLLLYLFSFATLKPPPRQYSLEPVLCCCCCYCYGA